MAKSGGTLSKLTLGAKFGLGAFLVTLVAVAYYVLLYGDLAARISSAQNQERQLKTDLSEAQKAQHAYQIDLADLSELEQRQQKLSKILPPTTEYPAFLSTVQSVANLTSVNLSAWTPQDESVEQFYARVPMRVELEGRFHQIAKFFYQVGQVDRIINMENISLTDPKAEGEGIVLKVNALATAFHALDESKAQAPTRKVQ